MRAGLGEIGKELRATRPELLVLCSPHHLRVPGHLAIADSAHLEGALQGPLGELRIRAHTNRAANRNIAAASAQCGLQPALCGFATTEESVLSTLPLDWGSLVPLSFVAAAEDLPPLALLGPPRDIGLEVLRAFGRSLANALSGRRYALIASADLGHAHDLCGPYGFDPAAAAYDAAVQAAAAAGDLSALANLSPRLVDAAKADAPWQLAILEGALGGPSQARHIVYARPSYFGMLCAGFTATN